MAKVSVNLPSPQQMRAALSGQQTAPSVVPPIITGPRYASGERPNKLDILYVGPPKSGKSEAASDSDRPLYLNFEKGNGLDYLKVPRLSPFVASPNFAYPFGMSYSEVRAGEAMKFIYDWLVAVGSYLRVDARQTYDTVVIDSIDNLLYLFAAAYRLDNNISGPLGKDGWNAVYEYLLPIIDGLHDLPNDCIWIVHTKYVFGDTPSDRRMHVAITPVVSSRFDDFADIICCVEVADIPGRPNRFIAHNRQFLPCGDRTGRLPDTLPMTTRAIYSCFTDEPNPEAWQPNVRRWVK